jgi:hypothetical protein
VRPGLVCQIMITNGRKMRSAPKRSLNVRGLRFNDYVIPGILRAEVRRSGIGSSKARG